MPAQAEPDTYEAFLAETHDGQEWVVAIVRRPPRTEAHRFARIALDVHAAARDVPVGDPHTPDEPLAEHLCGDPVDGLLLFPSTPGPLAPWAAYLLAVAAELVSDLCHHVAQSSHLHAIRFLLPQLRRQRPDTCSAQPRTWSGPQMLSATGSRRTPAHRKKDSP